MDLARARPHAAALRARSANPRRSDDALELAEQTDV
jgi:hypothetical protein